MRIRSKAVRSALLLAITTTLGLSAAASPLRAETQAQSEQESAPANCGNSCRGLGIEKVKAGDEHCGLVPRERKDESLAAACGLADAHREELQQQAEKKAAGKCGAELASTDCGCRGELRRWENVYTHVLSQRCWTECGWAFLVDCERRPETDG